MSGPLATGAGGGGGGGAPTDAQYVVLVANATLTVERVLTGTANEIVVTDGGAGAAVTLSAGTLIVQTDQANTWTVGAQQITIANAAVKGLIIKAAAAQTANLQEWQDSAGTLHGYWAADGTLVLGTSTAGALGQLVTYKTSVPDTFAAITGRLAGSAWQMKGLNFRADIGGQNVDVVFGHLTLLAGATAITTPNIYSGYISLNAGTHAIASLAFYRAVGPIVGTSYTGTLTTYYGVIVEDGSLAGTAVLTNQYGIYVENQALGATLNYAIYTNAGLVRFGDDVVMADAKNIQVNTTTGTMIGTATTQKLGFWGLAPVVQQVLATGAGATVDNVISMLQTLGLCKQA